MSQRPERSGKWSPDASKGFSQASRWLALPIGFVVWTGAAWLAGRWIDDRLGSEPWGQVVGAIVGWLVGIAYVYYGAQRNIE